MEREPTVSRVLLDTNAVSALFEPRNAKGGQPRFAAQQLRELRAKLAESHGRGGFGLVVPELVLGELASMPESIAEPRIRFTCELADGRVLRPWHELVADELRLGSRLPGAQACLEYEVAELVDYVCSRQDEFRAAHAKSIEAFRAHEEACKKELEKRAGSWRGRPFGQDTNTLLQSCEEWASEAAQEWARDLGLPKDPLPRAQHVPSLWAYYSYMTVRLSLTYSGQMKFHPGDAHDAFHYASAVYADSLVTCDGGLLRVSRMAPSTGFAVVHFDTWAQSWLGS